ncbi:hypothetical protein AAZX31_13G243600 [Glycine max]
MKRERLEGHFCRDQCRVKHNSRSVFSEPILLLHKVASPKSLKSIALPLQFFSRIKIEQEIKVVYCCLLHSIYHQLKLSGIHICIPYLSKKDFNAINFVTEKYH